MKYRNVSKTYAAAIAVLGTYATVAVNNPTVQNLCHRLASAHPSLSAFAGTLILLASLFHDPKDRGTDKDPAGATQASPAIQGDSSNEKSAS